MVKNKLIKKANEEYEYLVGDERIRRLAELKEKGLHEMASAKAAGIKKTRIDVAKGMLKESIDINVISKVTKLTKNEIEILIKK